MHIVFCYITRNTLPDYIYYSFKQFRMFNPDISTYFITNVNLPAKFNELNLKVVKSDTLNKTSKHVEFIGKNAMNGTRENRGIPVGFWVLSTERFFWIEELMKQKGLQNVIQIECDNLVYYDFKNVFNNIPKVGANHLVCGDRENHALANAICYFKNSSVISRFTDFLAEKSKLGYNKILDEFNRNGIPGRATVQVNDMCLTLLYYRLNKGETLNGEKVIDLFPLLPFDGTLGNDPESNQNFKNFGVIFDGAHWGMHIGGWPKCLIEPKNAKILGPGHKDASYYVGKLLISKRLEFNWMKDEKGRKVPIAMDHQNKTNTRITNLHIHCKEVQKFISY